MSEKKYELVMDDSTSYRYLYRIRALKDFSDVKAGDLGGYVSGEHNLSQEGNCWIYNNAAVFNNAKVYGNAKVYETAEVYGNAEICDCATVRGNAKVCGYASVFDNAEVYDCASVFDNAEVYDCAEVYGNAKVFDSAEVHGNCWASDNSMIYGDADLKEYSVIRSNADISSNKDYLCVKGLGSANRSTTAYRLSDGSIYVNCGCFCDTLDEFEMRVNKVHGDNKYGKEYKALIYICKLHFDLM